MTHSAEFDLQDYILHHALNAQEWNLPFLPPLHLPKFLTLHGLMIIFWAILLIFLFCFIYRKDKKAPSGITNLLEAFVVFIRDEIAIAQLGKEDGKALTPLFCTFFFFILGLNLMGMIPGFSTATANINVTGSLAMITLVFMIFSGIYKNGLVGFLKAFIPPHVPWPILLILAPLEFIGLFIRSAALMIRLFANMLAGHMIILALLGLVILLGWIALPIVAFAVVVSILEIFVAFLQAYIFTLLSAMFIAQTAHPQH